MACVYDKLAPEENPLPQNHFDVKNSSDQY